MTNRSSPKLTDSSNIATKLDNWLDQRTGIDSILHETLDEPIPGGASWAYVFGSGLLFLFVSQVITGVFPRPFTTCRRPTTCTPLCPTS